MYRSLWQFASIRELIIVSCNSVLLTFLQVIVFAMLGKPMPLSYYFICLLLLAASTGGTRFAYRALRLYKKSYNAMNSRNNNGSPITNVMIVGAGDAGTALARDMLKSDKYNTYQLKCFIDDEPTKKNRTLMGIKIIGNRNDIPTAVQKYDIGAIFIAMPSTDRNEVVKILDICKETKAKLLKLPTFYQVINGDVSINNLKEVEVKDLLCREQVDINNDDIQGYIKDKVVLVTGCGSIGSELVKQVANMNPKKLVLLDIYENNAYDLQQYLRRTYKDLDFETVIASVRDHIKIDEVFETYNPDIVFHCAAHKHVPLMEDSPNEAVKNNVFGTLNVARSADKCGAKKMILISTDKAVNPTNIMGATKRMCEMIIQTINKTSKTDFVAVRFGNVLESNGSVIPLFKQQIKDGGPVTVTDKNIIRYFMTIPEAVSLVLQAGSYAKGGEIFVLDMGEPVRIDDLAHNLIKLSGLEPGIDIEIQYTGLRPGEKLYEELLMNEEGMEDTDNKLIHIGHPIDFDESHFFEDLDKLKKLAYANSPDIKEVVKKYVTTYKPNNS